MTVLGACDRFEALLDRSQHHKPPQTKTPIACWFHAVRQSQAPWATMKVRRGLKSKNFESPFVLLGVHTIYQLASGRFYLTPPGLRELATQLRDTPGDKNRIDLD